MRYGLIAGNGRFPLLALETARREGHEVVVVAIENEAAPELDASTQTEPRSPDLAYTLAVLYNRGDMADRAVAFAEPYWKTVPPDYQTQHDPAAG